MRNAVKKYEYLSHRYEFPGGKIEPGEDPRDTVIREIREELKADISSADVEPYDVITFQYEDFSVELHNFLVYCDGFKFELTEHESYEWRLPEDMSSVEWVAADKIVVDRLLEDILSGKIKAA